MDGKSAPRSEDLEALRLGQEAQILLPHVERFYAKRRDRIAEMVFSKLRAGQVLDPQQAIQAWLELFAVAEFRLSLSRLATQGGQASSRIRPFVEGNSTQKD